MASKKKQETALVLRTCNADMTSHGGFQWPNDIGAVVEAPDWKKNNDCGNGLHGWLHGAGDSSASDSIGEEDAKWLVVEVIRADVVALGGKVKFPRCTIRHVGDKQGATEYLIQHEPRSAAVAVIGSSLQVGDHQFAQVGSFGLASGGDRSTLTGGYGSTLTGGYRSTLTGGDRSTLTGGYGSTLTGGDGSTLTGGYGSTLTGGDGSELRIRYWDSKANRYRTVIAYVGEDGIESGKPYKLDEDHKFVLAE